MKYITMIVLCGCMLHTTLNAQNLLKNLLNKDAVENAVKTVTKQKSVTMTDLAGTWKYAGPACEFESSDMLKKAGGAVISKQVEEQLDNLYSKAGVSVSNFAYTFNSDSSFTCQLGERTLKGQYSLDSLGRQVTLRYTAIDGAVNTGSISAYVQKSAGTLDMLFKTDKLLDLLSSLSQITDNATIGVLGKIAGSYDGMMIGYELKR